MGACRTVVAVMLPLLLAGVPAAMGQGPIPAISQYFYWRSHPPASILQATYVAQANEMLAARRRTIHEIKTKEEWIARAEHARSTFVEHVFAPLNLARTPLNVNVTREYHDDRGFTVKLLLFEAMPKYYVTCGLFIPDGASATNRRPGILFASGHWDLSWRDTTPQGNLVVIMNLVRKGFVVLAYDPPGQGERDQWWNATTHYSDANGCFYDPKTCQGYGGCTSEHTYAGRQLFLSNITLAAFWVWDGTRGLDVLGEQPEVDENRLGMTGCSGGGTQAAYLSAVDPRVLAAAPACYMGTFEVDLAWGNSGPDAEQQWPDGFPLGMNKPDLLEARLPNHTMVLITTDDGCFPAQGGRDAVREASVAFAAVGAADRLHSTEAVHGHGYATPNNENMYAFFQKALDNPGNSTEESLDLLSCGNLTVTATGQVATSVGGVFLPDYIHEATKNAALGLVEKRKDRDGFLAGLPATAAAVSGMRMDPKPESAEWEFIGSGAVTVGSQSALLQKWLVHGELPCAAVVNLWTPSSLAEGRKPVAVLSMGPPLGPSLAGNITESLLANGIPTAAISVCGMGEVGSPGSIRDSEAVSGLARYIGRSAPGFHAGDVVRALALVSNGTQKAWGSFPSGLSAVVTTDTLSPAVLHAATAAPHTVPALAVVGDTASFELIGLERLYQMPAWMEITGVLKVYDLPDLIAWRAPNPVLVVSPVGGNGAPLSSSEADSLYSFAAGVYQAKGAASKLQVVGGTLTTAQQVEKTVEWLKNL